MPIKTLADLISEPVLEDLAGDRSFARGVGYFRSGAVERLVSRNGRLSARVVGTDIYTAKLWPDGGRLDWDCTCPMGEDGEFCKHLVATGLAWLAAAGNSDTQTSSEIDAIRQFLEASDKQPLVDILTERACEDEDLAAQLLLAAQRHGISDVGTLKDMIRKAFSSRDFVDYHEMPGLAAGARPISDMLREVLKRDAKAALELSADAMKRGLKLLENSDDSDGLLGEILRDIAVVHRSASGKTPVAAAELAKNLFDLQLADSFGFFKLEEYLRALGNDGFAAYRKLAETAWKKVPPLGPGEEDDPCDDWRYQITEIMKTLVKTDGDVDALVDTLQRDLSEPYAYLEIAQVLAKAGRHDEALKWAEDGRKEFENRLNIPLDDFLVAEYHRRKRHDDAVALRWSRFVEQPGLHYYQELKAAADRSKNWKALRDKALAALRKPEARKPQSRYGFSWAESSASVLIEIFLWESDPYAALTEARSKGCPGYLWLQIAKALDEQSPADAIAIYQAQIEPIVRMTNSHAYDQAADLVRRIRDLMTRTGKHPDFSPYLDVLRTQHKAKRNFMQRLDALAAESRKK
ncbi:MAG: SWIM zinc finger family protein [Burkholderiales bacterium]